MNESVSMIKKKKPKKTADVHVYVHSLKILYGRIGCKWKFVLSYNLYLLVFIKK